MASRLPNAVESIPTQDIHVTVFVKAFPVARERFKTILIITDDPGPKDTRKVYAETDQMAVDFPAETAINRAFTVMKQQEPKPEKVLAWSTNRTAGKPSSDWSAALTSYVTAHSVDFYYVMITSRKEADVIEFQNKATTYEIMYFTANYPGDQAKISASTGATEIVVTRRRYGAGGNGDTVKFTTNTFDGAATTTAAKVANGAQWNLVVSLKNDGVSAVTATLAEVVAAINSTVGINEFWEAELGAGATGSTTAVAVETPVTLAGGGANATGMQTDGSDMTSTVAMGTTINHERVSIWVHTDPEGEWPEAAIIGMGSTREAGSFTFKNQKTSGVFDPGYDLTALTIIREGALNTFFIDFNGRLSTTDDWTTAVTYIDVQMKVDVITFLQRRELWDLISPPPEGRGITFDDEGILQIVNAVRRILREAATRRRGFIASIGGKAMAEVIWDDFRAISQGKGLLTSKADWQNRIFRLEWQATILHFVHEIFVTGYLKTDFIEPTLVI